MSPCFRSRPSRRNSARCALRVSADRGHVSDAVVVNTRLTLEIPEPGESRRGVPEPARRRDAYLPLLAFITLMRPAVPLRRGLRSRCFFALGMPLIFVYAMTSNLGHEPMVARRDSRDEGGQLVRVPSQRGVHMTYRALVVPESNRYIVPLLVAGFTFACFCREGEYARTGQCLAESVIYLTLEEKRWTCRGGDRGFLFLCARVGHGTGIHGAS